MNPYRPLGRIPWTGDWPTAKALPTQNITGQKNADVHSCLEEDSKPRAVKDKRAFDHTATGTGSQSFTDLNKLLYVHIFRVIL